MTNEQHNDQQQRPQTLRQRLALAHRRIIYISRREVRTFSKRPLFLFSMIIAPLLCIFFFTTLMMEGLPKRLPAAIVDEDDTHVTRIFCRMLDAFEETDIKYVYHNFTEARQAMQEGKIYAFFYIPKGMTRDCESQRQPTISFYTNDAYYVPANLLMRDMKTASVLGGLALTRSSLWGHGTRDSEVMGILQPIVIETHPMKNAFLDYSVYLSNMLVPGIIILLIMLTTTYVIGIVIYSVIFIFMDVWFFRYLGFPCNCGLPMMIGLGILTVLASQGFAVFLFGLMAGEMRLSMCICSLWGILSFSLAGFTFPVTAMSTYLRILSEWFPLRHYYLIYVDTALDGWSLSYVWPSVVALCCFALLPVLVLPRYRKAFLQFKYLV